MTESIAAPGDIAIRFLLKGVIPADNSAWFTCVFWVSMTVTAEMPIDEPMLRTRLNSAVASVRKRASSVAKATVDSGTNTSPSPSPWMIPELRISVASICGVKPDMV